MGITDPFSAPPASLKSVAQDGRVRPNVSKPGTIPRRAIGPKPVIRISSGYITTKQMGARSGVTNSTSAMSYESTETQKHQLLYSCSSDFDSGSDISEKSKSFCTASPTGVPVLFNRGFGIPRIIYPPFKSESRSPDVQHGMMLAKEWGFFVNNHKPWKNKTNDLEVPEHRRIPIDKEDAAEYAKKYGKTPPKVATSKPVEEQDIKDVPPNEITVQEKENADQLGLNIPAVGTRIEVDPGVASALAIAVAEATNEEDAQKGDKVAALTALLGNSISNAMNNPIDTTRFMAKD